MLLEQLKEQSSFTHHEKDVARYILENRNHISGMSASELASATLTSKATVVRLSQKLGLSGYQELKLKLIAEINQNDRISEILANNPITDKSSYSDIIHTLPVLYDKAITNTRLSLDTNSMNRINNILQKAECIDIYGTGISYILAQSAAFKFATLGIESSAYESINSHYLAARSHKKTIAFLISFTGANRTVNSMARYLKEAANNYIVGIMGPHSDEIRPWCHEIVEIPNRDSLLSLDVISSFTATTYILDIFFALLLSKRYDEHVSSSVEMLKHMPLLLNQPYWHFDEEPNDENEKSE